MWASQEGRPAIGKVVAAFAVIVVIVVGVVGLTSITSAWFGPTGCGSGCPSQVIMSSRSCMEGYFGFQVTRQYPDPTTWTFTLRSGSMGYMFYQVDVTKNLGLFLSELNSTWTIWQTYANGSILVAEVSGSTVTRVMYYPVKAPGPIIRPNQTYALGVRLSLVSYTVSGNVVDAIWSLTGILPGVYPVESVDFDWRTFNVTSPTYPGLNVTPETLTQAQYC